MPQQRKKKERSERLGGERDQIKFIDVGFKASERLDILQKNYEKASQTFETQGTILRSPKKGLTMARYVSPIEVQNCGIASHPSQSRQPRCIVFRKLFREQDFFRYIVYRISF